MKEIDLTGKCGSCFYFHKIAGKANGECHRFPYGDDVVHDPEHPFYQPTRSRLKCKEYRTNPLTNADRIRKWSDEEIAEFTIGVADRVFELFTGAKMPDETRREMKTEWLDWLKQEAKE